jgi:hypothetical protein
MIPQNGNILKFPVLPQNGMETVHMHLNKYFIEREGVVEPQRPPERPQKGLIWEILKLGYHRRIIAMGGG